MRPTRIAELLEPFLGLPEERPDTEALTHNISTYIDILVRWNACINLTAIRNPEEIVTRHFGESLFAAGCLFPNSPVSSVPTVVEAFDSGPTVADVGSGAGFPGLPIKLWTPQVSLTLIESNHKKAAFLKEVSRALTLTNINIQNARAESLSAMTFDVVTLRAVERFEAMLPTAARLLSPGARLALLIGESQLSAATTTLPDLAWSTPMPIPQSRSRILVIATRQK